MKGIGYPSKRELEHGFCVRCALLRPQVHGLGRWTIAYVVDNFSRRCLAIHADQSIKGSDVREIVSRISARAGQAPERIQVDNGSESNRRCHIAEQGARPLGLQKQRDAGFFQTGQTNR